jgi:hypothetical protein
MESGPIVKVRFVTLVSHLAIIQAGFHSDPPAAGIHIAAI